MRSFLAICTQWPVSRSRLFFFLLPRNVAFRAWQSKAKRNAEKPFTSPFSPAPSLFLLPSQFYWSIQIGMTKKIFLENHLLHNPNNIDFVLLFILMDFRSLSLRLESRAVFLNAQCVCVQRKIGAISIQEEWTNKKEIKIYETLRRLMCDRWNDLQRRKKSVQSSICPCCKSAITNSLCVLVHIETIYSTLCQ